MKFKLFQIFSWIAFFVKSESFTIPDILRYVYSAWSSIKHLLINFGYLFAFVLFTCKCFMSLLNTKQTSTVEKEKCLEQFIKV